MYLDTTYKPELVYSEKEAAARPLCRIRVERSDNDAPDRGHLVVTNGRAIAALSTRVEPKDDLDADVPVEVFSEARAIARRAKLGELRIELRPRRAVAGGDAAFPREDAPQPGVWRHVLGPARGEAGTVTLALDAAELLSLAECLGGARVPPRVALTFDPRDPSRAIGVELIDGPLQPEDVGALAPCRSNKHLGPGERTSIRVDKPKENGR